MSAGCREGAGLRFQRPQRPHSLAAGLWHSCKLEQRGPHFCSQVSTPLPPSRKQEVYFLERIAKLGIVVRVTGKRGIKQKKSGAKHYYRIMLFTVCLLENWGSLLSLYLPHLTSSRYPIHAFGINDAMSEEWLKELEAFNLKKRSSGE